MALLKIENLQTEFSMRQTSVRAVDDFSLTVEEGECAGIVGESGCGKTTAGLSVMRLLPRNGRIVGGQVIFEGADLASLSEKQMQSVRGNGIALIPQDPMTSLNPVQRIGRQVAEGFRIHGIGSKSAAYERALEVLRLVEMPNPEERLNQYPHELSGGLRQRVMIAMALVCSPKVLIADEPTTALDVTIQAQILDILDGLREKLGMAIILITHDMGVIAGRTDNVTVMYAGKAVEKGSTEELFSQMRHPYTQALLDSVPSLTEVATERLRSIPGLPPDLSKEIVGCRFAPRCSFATEECRLLEPPLTSPSGDDHVFACFHPVDGPSLKRVHVADIATLEAATPIKTFEPMLSVQGLVKDFPIRGSLLRRSVGTVSAVADVSFDVGKGETFGLVGESGCGKTTIGRLIVGLEAPTAGSIFFEGEPLSMKSASSRKAAARHRQMMFQDPYASLDPRKRVDAIVREPLEIQRIGTAASRKQRVGELLTEIGLAPEAGQRYPHEFSGGQRQRIGLARALALEPNLVIADEPVSALDVSIQAQILNLMQDLQEAHGLSYIIISHDLAVVRHIADRIGVMYLGKLVEMGPAAEVFGQPAHHYTQGLLDAVPVLDVQESRARRGRQVQGELPSAANPPSGCRFRTRCPAAQELCAQEVPAISHVTETHTVACHFPLRRTKEMASAAPAEQLS